MASPRERAASIATAKLSLTLFCPMTSASRCGRSFSSNEESSSTGAAETKRSRLGLRLGLFFAVATASDGRTKCEAAQLPSVRWNLRRLHHSSQLKPALSVLSNESSIQQLQ